MILLPAMKHIFDTTGVRPVMAVCSEFASTLEGVSYVTAWPLDGLSWYADVKTAKKIAEHWFDKVIIPKWWDCPGLEPPPPLPEEPSTVLTHLGRKMTIPASEWDSYQCSQWRAAGFNRVQLAEWPLVFDRRSPEREAQLCSKHMLGRKPIVLYNFSGLSNQMPFEPEVMKELSKISHNVSFVDMRHIRAERIYDMLGMYDRALCVITGDTSTLHLAAASPVPCIAMLANGGAGSVPKGNTVLKLRYHQVRENVAAIRNVVEQLYEKKTQQSKPLHPIPALAAV
jgi:hypothetical protein